MRTDPDPDRADTAHVRGSTHAGAMFKKKNFEYYRPRTSGTTESPMLLFAHYFLRIGDSRGGQRFAHSSDSMIMGGDRGIAGDTAGACLVDEEAPFNKLPGPRP